VPTDLGERRIDERAAEARNEQKRAVDEVLDIGKAGFG